MSLAIEYVLYGQGCDLADFDKMIEENSRNPRVNEGAEEKKPECERGCLG